MIKDFNQLRFSINFHPINDRPMIESVNQKLFDGVAASYGEAVITAITGGCYGKHRGHGEAAQHLPATSIVR